MAKRITRAFASIEFYFNNLIAHIFIFFLYPVCAGKARSSLAAQFAALQ